LAIAAAVSLWATPRAAAQAPAFGLGMAPDAGRPLAPFLSLDLDGGLARSSEHSRWLLLGAATAGLGLYNGLRVWTFNAGVRGMRNEGRAAVVAVSRTSVESGFGLHGGGLWDFGRAAPGVSAGLSLSLLNLQGDLLFDGARTCYLSLFVRVPVGFLAHLAFGGRR
jgi:hypothetical protein